MARMCRETIITGHFGGELLIVLNIKRGTEMFSLQVTEVVQRAELPIRVVILTQVAHTFRFGIRVVLTSHMIWNKVHNHFHSGFVCSLHKSQPFIHSVRYVLGQIRIDVVVVLDSIRRAGFALHNSRMVATNAIVGIIGLSGMFNDAGVPHVRCTQTLDFSERFRCNQV